MKILFVSHDAALTGAPIALLRLVSQLGDTEVDPYLVVRRGGPLLEEFMEVGPTVLAPAAQRIVGPRSIVRRMSSVAGTIRLRRFLRKHGPFDAAYLNTCSNASVLSYLRQEVPIVTAAHEMGFYLDNKIPAGGLKRLVDVTDHWIACSNPVRRDLVERGVDREHVSVVSGAVHVPDGGSRERGQSDQGDHLVLGVGTVDWRKGPDLFLNVAAHVVRNLHRTDVKFRWIGRSGGLVEQQMNHDIRRAGLVDSVRFTGEQHGIQDVVREASVLALTSREDPYPLVMLEAGSHGVPIVSFDGSGGADDYVAEGGGVSVPYLDVVEMAAAIDRLCSPGRSRHFDGDRAAEHVRLTSDASVTTARVVEILRDVTEAGKRGSRR